VAERLIEEALDQREMADSVQAQWESLTPREQQVTALVCKGYGNERIACELFISPATVKIHQRNVLNKLNLPSKAALHEAFRGFDFSPE
jgi:LuxR family maltose regulon positive regulatory protein